MLNTVITSEVAYHDVTERLLTAYPPYLKDQYFRADPQLVNLSEKIINEEVFPHPVMIGRGVTGEEFVDHENRAKIIKQFAPQCVDMETAAVAHICHTYNIPFLGIRTMSDDANNSSPEQFRENLPKASQNSFEVVDQLLQKL